MSEDTNSKKVIYPFCKKETSWRDNPLRPFCSERCRLIDLGEWASGKYRIAGDNKKNYGEGASENNKKS